MVRVTVLVDAYNLCYAGRKLCERGVAGWRWLDIRSLAEAIVAEPDRQPTRSPGGASRV